MSWVHYLGDRIYLCDSLPGLRPAEQNPSNLSENGLPVVSSRQTRSLLLEKWSFFYMETYLSPGKANVCHWEKCLLNWSPSKRISRFVTIAGGKLELELGDTCSLLLKNWNRMGVISPPDVRKKLRTEFFFNVWSREWVDRHTSQGSRGYGIRELL